MNKCSFKILFFKSGLKSIILPYLSNWQAMYGFVAIKIERKITLLPRLKGGQRTRARLVIPFLIFNDINGPHPNPPLVWGGNCDGLTKFRGGDYRHKESCERPSPCEGGGWEGVTKLWHIHTTPRCFLMVVGVFGCLSNTGFVCLCLG